MIKLDYGWGFVAFTMEDVMKYRLYNQIFLDYQKDIFNTIKEALSNQLPNVSSGNDGEEENVNEGEESFPQDLDQRVLQACKENQYILGFVPFCSVDDFTLANIVFPYYEDYNHPSSSHRLGLFSYDLKNNEEYLTLLKEGKISSFFHPSSPPCLNREGEMFFIKDHDSAWSVLKFFNEFYKEKHPLAPPPGLYGYGLSASDKKEDEEKEKEKDKSKDKEFYPTVISNFDGDNSLTNYRAIAMKDCGGEAILFSSRSGFTSDQIRFIAMLMNEAYELGRVDEAYEENSWQSDRDWDY